MKTPNNQLSANDKQRKLTKQPKAKESLSFATWVLLIISFTLLAYAIYTIKTRILESDTDKESAPQSSLVQIES